MHLQKLFMSEILFPIDNLLLITVAFLGAQYLNN